MIIIDASVLAHALIDDELIGDRARAELAADTHWVAPEHLIVETISVIRGVVLGGKTSVDRGAEAITELANFTVRQLRLSPLAHRIWELRANVSAYDAAYIAAAETFGCPLVTADGKLACATGPRCEIRLVDGN